MADLKLGNVLPVGADNVVVKGKYVQGGYIVVSTISERDGLLTEGQESIVVGSLCYCQATDNFYTYTTDGWVNGIYTKSQIDTALSGKQATLISGSNIKTVNGQSILGSGDLSAGLVDDVTQNGVSIVENKIAKIVLETGLGSDSGNSATVTAIRAFVNSSIEAVAAYYITSNTTGDAFATKAALDAGPWYYAGNPRTPTRNDYAIVTADETHEGKSARYCYTDNQWAFQYTFNMSFTQAQIDAINSGITAIKVALYDAHLAAVNNPHSVTKVQVGLGNVGNFKAVSTESNQGLTTTEQQNARANIGAENVANKTTILSAESTNVQYPSAKAVYDAIQSVPISDPNAVHYTADTDKTAEEKAQARTNIGAGTGSYDKPDAGIPTTDLETSAQTSLGLADTAVQPATLDGYLPLTAGSTKLITDGLYVKYAGQNRGERIALQAADTDSYAAANNPWAQIKGYSWNDKHVMGLYCSNVSLLHWDNAGGGGEIFPQIGYSSAKYGGSVAVFGANPSGDIYKCMLFPIKDGEGSIGGTQTWTGYVDRFRAWNESYINNMYTKIGSDSTYTNLGTYLNAANPLEKDSNGQLGLKIKTDGGLTVDADGLSVNTIDGLSSTSATSPLSANQGKILQTEIQNLKNIGRFLAILDASAGTVSSQPEGSVGELYNYKVGDYYRIGVAGTYGPRGTATYTIDETSGSSNFETGTTTYNVGDVIYCSNLTESTSVWVKQASSGGGTVQDVQIDNTSILSGGIANIPIASSSELGVSKIASTNGIDIGADGTLCTVPAIEARLVAKDNAYQPVTSTNLDIAIREGLGNNGLTWSSEYQAAARSTIGAQQMIEVRDLD